VFSIHCSPDQNDLSSPTWGTIYLEVDGQYYPHKLWQDCCSRVLGAWLTSAALEEDYFENSFQEGNYAFTGRRQESNVTLDVGNKSVTLPWLGYVSILTAAANDYLAGLSSLRPTLSAEDRSVEEVCRMLEAGKRLTFRKERAVWSDS